MQNIKRILFLLLCLPLSSFATPTVASNPYNFLINFTGYLTSVAGNNDYGVVSSDNTTTLLSPQNTPHFAYSMDITYFNNHDTWYLSYQQLDPHWQTNSITNADEFTGELNYRGQDRLTQVNFEHGSLYTMTSSLILNLHSGLSYIDEKSQIDLNGNYTGDTATLQHGQTQFSGFGPIVGVTITRQINQYFDFSNTANVGLLYGDYQANSEKINSSNVVVSQAKNPIHSIIVPQLDVNFALSFHHALSHKARLQTQVGIQFQQLFNVTNTQDASQTNNQNVAFYGPFWQVGCLF